MQIKAVYPGTFDPMTNGHIDVAKRACKMFEKVILAVSSNPGKNPFFSLDERIALAKEALADVDNIEIKGFTGLLVDCAREEGARVIVRGLRAVADFEYEVQLAGLNRQMAPEIETAFVSAAHKYAFVSSSLLREIAQLSGDVTQFVHPAVQKAMLEKLNRAD
ncbi:MAG: pantetheine-phosphate adenylyltransferase [Gammaproteobacteria bacterium]|nr:pantetheine-phosphate adenylyltransferase [Gammaproteobacteria bacterium]